MRLYRKVVPKIARDVIVTLGTKKLIELEDGKISEAELDLAAVMVEYLNAEDNLIKDARDLLARRGLGPDRFAQVVKSLAEMRGLKVGEGSLDHILNQMIETLFASPNVAEVYGEDHEIRKIMKEQMDKYLAVSEELDQQARARLKNIKEGSPDWEIEYPRMIAQLKRQKGVA